MAYANKGISKEQAEKAMRKFDGIEGMQEGKEQCIRRKGNIERG